MMIDEDIDYSKMKIFPGEMFTTRELKSRLNAMDVLIDPNVKEKRYYIAMYNQAIKDDSNKDKIYGRLFKDNNPGYKGELPYKRSLPYNVNEESIKQPMIEDKKEEKVNMEMNNNQINRNEFSSNTRRENIFMPNNENIINTNKRNEYFQETPFNENKEIYSTNNQLFSNNQPKINNTINTNNRGDYSMNSKVNQTNKSHHTVISNPVNSIRQTEQNIQRTSLFQYEIQRSKKATPVQFSKQPIPENIITNYQVSSKSPAISPIHKTNLTSAEYNRLRPPTPVQKPNSFENPLPIEPGSDSNLTLIYGLCFGIFAILAVGAGYYYLFREIGYSEQFQNVWKFVKDPKGEGKKMLIKAAIKRGVNYLINHFFYSIPLIVLGIVIEVIRRQRKKKQNVEVIFNEICERLRNMCSDEENGSDGLAERQIINDYSSQYNVTYEEFSRVYMPMLRKLRRQNANLKLYENYYEGQRQLFWQWVN